MKRRSLISIILSLAIMLSIVIFPANSATALFDAPPLASSDEPVIPKESEFAYRAIPVNNPVRVTITKYSGSASKIIIPETINGLPVEIIAASAFSDNEKITYVKIPSQVKSISGYAFSKCYSLTDIDVDESNEAFKSIDGVLYKRNTDSASADFGKAQTLAIYPAGKKGSFTIPFGISAIGSYAFYYCINLTGVDMHNSVTSIEANAFSYCWNLESLRLSDNLKTIGDRAFASCDSLSQLSIPSTVTTIGSDAFLGGIDSKDNKFYYFTDGVYCEKDSYAYEYLVGLHLPLSIIKPMHRSITNPDMGITFVDAYSILPEDKHLELSVTPVEPADVDALFSIKYSRAFVYDIVLTDENGKEYAPNGYFVLNFDEIGKTAYPTATKIYKLTDDNLVPVNGTPNIPFIGAQTTSMGRFVVLVNDDFSLKGDIDGDGIISIHDARTALYNATGLISLSDEQREAGNVDNSSDKRITTADARLILRHASGIINEF